MCCKIYITPPSQFFKHQSFIVIFWKISFEGMNAVGKPHAFLLNVSQSRVGLAGVKDKLWWCQCSLCTQRARLPPLLSPKYPHTELSPHLVSGNIHRITSLSSNTAVRMVKLGSIGKCWGVGAEYVSPLQTLRQDFVWCFYGTPVFWKPFVSHGAPLGCVRQILKQQTTDAITVADCCETLSIMWAESLLYKLFFFTLLNWLFFAIVSV